MQFTPQQLTGGPKFNHCTRIGNWNEDMGMSEIMIKDYLAKKESGTLMVTAKQRQLEECLAPAQLSETPDGVLRFGQSVQLVSHQSQGVLSCNPYETVTKAYESWVTTTSADAAPSVRNVINFQRTDRDDFHPDDDVIHYGQKVRCNMQPFSKMGVPAYMHSELVTALAAAKFSRHQEVTMFSAPNGETQWEILYPDITMRNEMEGEAVMAGAPIVLKHCATGCCLASDHIPYKNIFGTENEVHCFNYESLGKAQNLVGEMKGEITADTPLRKVGLANIWSVVSATHAPTA
jgi:hypothetical protein